MKYLLPLLLSCLLFSGCGVHTPEETIPPTEPVAGEICFPEEYGGAVQCTALNLKKVRGMIVFGENILLLSGQDSTTLTLLDPETMTEQANVTFDCLLTQEDLVITPEGTLSFFDTEEKKIILLDHTLQETGCIRLPGGIQGDAFLWGDTIYYCTASEIRAWDLNTDIRRRVKEMAWDSQSITGVLLEGAVLQCTVTAEGQTRTLFLSSTDGRLLRALSGNCAIDTHPSGFYGTIASGSYELHLFGQTSAQLLTPRDITAACYFLPGQQAAVTAAGGCLEYYDLTSGLLRCILSLGPYQDPIAAATLAENRVLFLTHDPARNRDVLFTWDISPGNPTALRDNTAYVQPYYSADSPDTEGLELCSQLAREVGAPGGLTVRFWKDAAAKAPSGHILEPEHQVLLIQRDLALLDRWLRQYPKGLLVQTAARFSSLNLCLVRSAAGEGCGAFFLDGTDAYVVIPMGEEGEQALAHGLFHAMEIHIFSKSHTLDQWDKLNPAGFQYDYDYDANSHRDSGVYLFQEHRSFVDTFSMSYSREDRARIFEYAMSEGQDSLFRPDPMQKKLQTLCTGIREAYRLEGNEGLFSWEQYLD